jgi:putative lipoprotein
MRPSTQRAMRYGKYNHFHQLMIILAALVVVILGSSAMSETRYVDVTVSYRERIALPPDAELQVEIQDVSRADAPATVLDHQRVPVSRVPITVRLGVDDAIINEKHSYSARGAIFSAGKVLFRSTSVTPVLTRGAPDAVDLQLVAAGTPSTGSGPGNPLAGVEWEVFELGGRMLIVEDLPTIAFNSDGRFGLYGGCNRFTGTATIGEGTIVFPVKMAGTRRACSEVRAKLEKDVLDALAASSGFVRNGALLSLTNSNGVTLVRFKERPG